MRWWKNRSQSQKFWIVTLVAYGIIVFISRYFWKYEIITWPEGTPIDWKHPRVQLGKMLFLMWLVYVGLSYYLVGPKQKAVKLFLRKPIQDIDSGYAHTPLGFVTIEVESRLVDQIEVPADAQHVWKGDGEPPEGSGLVSPLRIPTGGAQAGDVTDPLDGRLTLEPAIYCRYRIKSYGRFIQTIGDFEQARKQIEDTIVGVVTEEFANRTPRQVIAAVAEINDALELKIRILVEGDQNAQDPDKKLGWGAEVEDVRLKLTDLSKTVNTALAKLTAGRIAADQTRVAALAEEFKRTHEGIGTAEAQKVLLEAQGTGYRKIAQELGIDEGQVVLMAQTAREMLENSQYSFIAGSGGMADVFNTITALKDALGRINPPTSPTHPVPPVPPTS